MYRSFYSPESSRFSHSRGLPPSIAQMRQAALDAISTLEKAGVKDTCFVGGMACTLFGNSREPNDLDILCPTTTWEVEALKRELVYLNPSFYLVPARSPLANYKVLWYRLADNISRLKVDLLFPGVLDIQSIPASSITSANPYRLPCAPFLLVLLLKLQAWIHHGEALEFRYRAKQPTDARDIRALLPIACSMKLHLKSENYLPKSFVEVSKSRVEKFMRWEPDTKKDWEALGLVQKVVVAPGRVLSTSIGGSGGTKPSTTARHLQKGGAHTRKVEDIVDFLDRLRLAEHDMSRSVARFAPGRR